MSRHQLFTCDHCKAEYLIDTQTNGYECLSGPPSEIYNPEEVYIEEDDRSLDLDLDESLEEPEITAEPEPTHSYAADHQEAYKRGAPVVLGTDVVKSDGKRVRVNKPSTNQGSGITVETSYKDARPNPTVRQQTKKTAVMKPMGSTTPFAPPKKKAHQLTDADHDNPELEVSGNSASQDYTGLGGAEQHFDNLLQEAYENDLKTYGF